MDDRLISNWCIKNNISLRQCLSNSDVWISYGELLDKLPKYLHKYYNGIDKERKLNRYLYLDKVLGGQPSFVFIIPSYNNINYVKINLESVFKQICQHYRVIYIDDCSRDGTYQKVKELVDKWGMWGKFRLYRQPVRNYQSGSRFSAYHLRDDDEILCMLDGDDWLLHNKVLNELIKLYRKGAMVTYGSYHFYYGMVLDKHIYGNEKFPKEVLLKRNFRHYRWTSCHLRTGYGGLFKRIKLVDMLDKRNTFLRCCTDLCEMYPVLEMASPFISCSSLPLYVYNRDASQLNSNSYYNRKKNPIEELYRNYVMTKIKTTPKYPSITLKEIFHFMNYKVIDNKYSFSSNIKKESCQRLVKLLEITKLNCLGIKLKINNPLILYDKNIKIGRLLTIPNKENIYITLVNYELKIGDLVISLDSMDIDLWDK